MQIMPEAARDALLELPVALESETVGLLPPWEECWRRIYMPCSMFRLLTAVPLTGGP
jgi:hypothetical protein